jgi:hypothetical protein
MGKTKFKKRKIKMKKMMNMNIRIEARIGKKINQV